jgi:hypothetical protein
MVSQAGDGGEKLSKQSSRKMLPILAYTLAPNGLQTCYQLAT